ncbi:MAG: ATP-binding protein, partial [Candidatus Saccharimonadales bacterium]
FISSLQTINSAEHNDFVKEKAERSSQQNQLMTLINSVNEAIISINAHGTVQLYNAATLNLLDTNESLSGKKLDEVLSTYSETGEPIKLFNELKNSAPSITRQDLELRFADGETMSLDISSSRIRGIDNETQGYILVIRDITRSKSFDEERDEFISVVSHELRTPVTITEGTISNSIMLIEKGAAPSVVAQALSSAHEQTLYLARMINDLSTLSRAERGVGAEKESIDVTDLMHQLYNEYHKKASEKKLRLNLDISPTLGTVEASRLYLEEVLQNFLTNAIKYTQKGTITLTARRQKGTIVFAVTDTGIGISKHEQKKVFEKFYRAEDYRTRETNGTGLGLYVVKKLADKMGISIDLSSRLNHGSTFSFSLPSVVVDKSSSKK